MAWRGLETPKERPLLHALPHRELQMDGLEPQLLSPVLNIHEHRPWKV